MTTTRKHKMITFFDTLNIDVREVVETGYQAPTNDEGAKIPRT